MSIMQFLIENMGKNHKIGQLQCSEMPKNFIWMSSSKAKHRKIETLEAIPRLYNFYIGWELHTS